MRRELIISSLLAISVRVAGALSAFVVTFFVARKLSADQAGLYFLCFSVVTVLSGFARMGLDNTVVRFCGIGEEQGKSVVLFSFIVVFAVSLFLSSSLYACSDLVASNVFGKAELASVLRSMAPGLIGLSLLTLSAMAMQGFRYIVNSIFTLSIFSNVIIVVVLICFSPGSAQGLGMAYSFVVLLVAAYSITWVFKKVPASTEKLSYRAIFASSTPLWLENSMTQLVQWSGQFVAGIFVSSSELAMLAVAQRVSMLGSFVLVAVNLVVAPRIARCAAGGDLKEVERVTKLSIVMVLAMASPLVLVLMLFPQQVLSLFGAEYASGAVVLRILVIGQIVNAATGSVAYVLMMSGNERDMRNITFISGLLAISSALFLTPLFSVQGSAVATALAVSVQNLLAVYFVYKRFGFNALLVFKK